MSLYNESKATGGGSAILPTPAIGGVGIIEDYSKMMTMALKEKQDILLIGSSGSEHLGQSTWLREVRSEESGSPPAVDLQKELEIGELIRRLIQEGKLTAVHDISDGGALVAIAEMALAGNVGAEEIWLDALECFGEDQARYVVTCPTYEVFSETDIPFRWIGVTGTNSIRVNDGQKDVANIPLTDLREAHDSFFRDWMET